ncbi:hypothetical protein [Actinokineospora enzanensis]|uniref:hypothetical protein n=1 Tax=Actinokineospora enzanensis TaxID=155975 RepID=UPI000379F7AB|nr:hypothetical protein [Actinokineospora enzanensis]
MRIATPDDGHTRRHRQHWHRPSPAGEDRNSRAGEDRNYRENRVELVALRQAALVNDDFANQLQGIVRAESSHLREHLESITEAGRPPAGDPDLLVSAVTSLLDQFAYTWLAAGGDGSGRRIDDDEAVDTLTELLYCGLAGHPG